MKKAFENLFYLGKIYCGNDAFLLWLNQNFPGVLESILEEKKLAFGGKF